MGNQENSSRIPGLGARINALEKEAYKHLDGYEADDVRLFHEAIEDALFTVTPWDMENDKPIYDVPRVEHFLPICHKINESTYHDYQDNFDVVALLATFALDEAYRAKNVLTEGKFSEAVEGCIDGWRALAYIPFALKLREKIVQSQLRSQIASDAAIERDNINNKIEREEVIRIYCELRDSGEEVVDKIQIRKKNGTINYSKCARVIIERLINRERPRIPQKDEFVYKTILNYEKSLRDQKVIDMIAEEDAAIGWSKKSWPMRRL